MKGTLINCSLIKFEEDDVLSTINYKITLISFPEESDDDILTVKRKDHAIGDGDVGQDDDDEPLLQPQSKAKVVTKAALAKKVMKKKIQSNQVHT